MFVKLQPGPLSSKRNTSWMIVLWQGLQLTTCGYYRTGPRDEQRASKKAKKRCVPLQHKICLKVTMHVNSPSLTVKCRQTFKRKAQSGRRTVILLYKYI